MFKNLKLHDKVFSIRHGWGTVTCIDEDDKNGLNFRFLSDNEENVLWFDRQGKQSADHLYPSIYWDVPQITIPKRPLPVDAPILVRDTDNEVWTKRHFKSHTKDGGVSAWVKGLTSFTVENSHDFTYWKQWKLPDEEG